MDHHIKNNKIPNQKPLTQRLGAFKVFYPYHLRVFFPSLETPPPVVSTSWIPRLLLGEALRPGVVGRRGVRASPGESIKMDDRIYDTHHFICI